MTELREASVPDRSQASIVLQRTWYMSSIVAYMGPMGIQAVLLPWIVSFQLGLGSDALGFAQMLAQLPALLLILVGGLVADRVDGRRLLAQVHVGASVAPLLLATAAWFSLMDYTLVLAYALANGVAMAFVQPARDAMLNRVAGEDLQRAVTLATGLMFGAQIVGFAAGSSADAVGAVPLLLLQGGVILLGALFVMQLHPAPPLAEDDVSPAPDDRRDSSELFAGVKVVLASSLMLPTVILTFVVGVFFAGTFMVLLPILIRDVYGGGSAEVALTFGVFMVGTVVVAAILLAAGGMRRPGIGVFAALWGGSLVLALVALTPPFPMVVFAVFLWGVGGGIVMTMSRTVMQTFAPESHRARVLAIYSMGHLGGAPIGAMLMGIVVDAVGPVVAILLPCVCVVLLTTLVALTSPLWGLRLADNAGSEAPGA